MDLATRSTLPATSNLVRDRHGFLAIAEGSTEATLLTPVFSPHLAEAWDGFMLYPDEVGLAVQVSNPETQQSYAFVEGSWQSGVVWQAPAIIRQGLPHWHGGAIQFKLQLTRQPNGRSPRVFGLKIGFEVNRDLQAYILEYSLPALLAQSIKLNRFVSPLPDGRSVEVPIGFDPAKVSNPTILGAHSRQRYPLTPTNTNPVTLRANILLPEEPLELSFGYIPHIEHEPYLYQISTIPTVLVRAGTPQRERRLRREDWVSLATSDQMHFWQSAHCYDLPVQITAIAEGYSEARAIANQLLTVMARGYLEVPGFGAVIPVEVTRSIERGPGLLGDDLNEGALTAMNFQVQLLQLLEGETVQQQPLVATFAPPQPNLIS